MRSTTMRLPIRWSDQDVMGHVNNLSTLNMAQCARVQFLREIDLSPCDVRFTPDGRYGPILAALNVQYYHQLHFPGNVTIRTQVEWVKTTSFQLRHTIFDENDVMVAETTDVLVFFDYLLNVKHPIPDHIRVLLEGEPGESRS